VVLVGSSGAGKSTLTNTLAGRALQDTGAVREHDSRGKHTTTSASSRCAAADRLRNYHKLLREARRDSMTILERQQQLSIWKARGKAGRARLKMKMGEA